MPERPPFPFLTDIVPQVPRTLLDIAHGLPVPRVALVNAGSETALQGIREAADHGLAEPVLIGDTAKIRETAQAIGWDIAGLRIDEAPGPQAAPRAAMLAVAGEVDAIMKGQIHTSTFLRGLLPAHAGLREPDARCGHVFHITAPGSDRPLLLTDAALNVDPDVETRRACLTHAVALARRLGVESPKAGLLAPSEDVVAAIAHTGASAAIAAWAKDALPQAVVQGPMALDLIWSAEAARIKGYDSAVAGDADIVLAPNITTGNAVFKLMVFGMGCCAAGIVLGAKVPILLTSRAQKSAARIGTAALGAIAAAAP
ncbi:phosphate acetyltransferase [Oceaniovalibus guishaninsula JLT2003]|uniref:Phosphate acetyltransferase n=1 Tax=Oceaniovalibus guishaninsula JLT2003 TaxID=1231392 RepID=K2H8R7_9RHOB|nr:phosphate acyltransferase [Oceaniovalibus guishaninsula]EKE43973.1 phosphate acetyltransferase [Oceaniovalibus guishaninsula JLT2003]